MSRFRSRHVPTLTAQGTYQYWDNNGNTVGPTNVPYIASAGYDQMLDTVTPNYRERSARGEVIINPVDRDVYSYTCANGTINAYSVPFPKSREVATGDVIASNLSLGGTWSDSYGLDPKFDFNITTEINQTRLQAIAGLDRTPYALMEDLLELRQAVSSVSGVLSSAKYLADKFRKKKNLNLLKGVSPEKAIADAWLGIRFGMQPLIGSLFNIADSMKRNAPVAYTKSSSSLAVTRTDQRAVRKTRSNGVIDYYSVDHGYTSKIRSVAYCKVTNPAAGIPAMFGLRGKDIPAGIWAVMPYSWAIDRFVDVTTWLKACSNIADPNVHIIGACTSCHDEGHAMVSLTGINASSVQWSVSASGTRTTVRSHYYRYPFAPSSVITSVPVNTEIMNLKQITDLGAIVVQRLR